MKNELKLLTLACLIPIAGCSKLWNELKVSYDYDKNKVDVFSSGHSMLIFKKENYEVKNEYFRKAIAVSYSENGIVFSRYVPLLGVVSSIELPTQEIGYCFKKSSPNTWDTGLWITPKETEISISDSKLDVYKWCTENRINIVSREEFNMLVNTHNKSVNSQP